jgi:hypothetical protein
MLNLVREKQVGQRTFHDQEDFIFEGVPGHIYEALGEFNAEVLKD